jgi:tRNA(Ile)-lysidine synthase
VPTADGSALTDAEARRLFDVFSSFPASVLAVSGGPDSTALLVLAARWRKSLERPPKLVAVTVDHGLRPESKREAAAVKRLAAALGIEHRTLCWTGPKPRTGLPEAAREARYRLLAKAARQAGARHVLTAHTLDDQAETLLMRMARGSGVSGLTGMGLLGRVPVPEERGVQLARPFLGVPKSRLIATLKAARVPYADDPTNRDPQFTRPRLRALMPALAQEGLTAARLGQLARRVERVEDTLLQVLNAAQMHMAPGPWPELGPVTIAAQPYAELPEEIALRLLGRAIAWTGDEGPVELGKLEALRRDLSEAMQAASHGPGNSGRFRRTLAGAVVTLAGGRLLVQRAPPRRSAQARSASKRP